MYIPSSLLIQALSQKTVTIHKTYLMLNSLPHLQIYRAFKRFFFAFVIVSLQNTFWNSINSFLRMFDPGSCIYLISKSLAFTSLQKRHMEKICITFNSILKLTNISKCKVLVNNFFFNKRKSWNIKNTFLMKCVCNAKTQIVFINAISIYVY